ncbi:hypothetical protein FOC4_g10002439, partial [Fusarium odoratissimum]
DEELLVGIRSGGGSLGILSFTIIYYSSGLEIVITAYIQHYEQMVATRELPVYLQLHSIILQLVAGTDWSDDPYKVLDGEDPMAVRTDPPGTGAITPDPMRMKQLQRPRSIGMSMSGALPSCLTLKVLDIKFGPVVRNSTVDMVLSILRVSRHSSSYITPSITDDDDDDDDEAHFSDLSDRTIKPFRLRQKEPAYFGIPSDSSVSNSNPAGAGLDSPLSKTEMRMKYLLNIIKLMVPWKRDMDEWRT